jgi:DNA-binding NarL/FixJ family response regulator
MRVVMVDDYPPFLTAVKALLEQEQDIEVAGLAHSGQDGLKLASALKPDLVLLDFSMPDMNGVAVTRALKSRPDAPKVVILSFHAEPEYKDMALHAGADGYVVKTELYKDLLPLLRSLAG